MIVDAKNTLALITGCQRSGTTLLNLILDSHPEITGIDEMDADASELQSYLTHPRYHPCVTLKLPAACHEVKAINSLVPNLKVIWCIRDPRDVVLSMASLRLQISEAETMAWVNHPQGARREIANCFPALSANAKTRLLPYLKKYSGIEQQPPGSRSRDSAIFTGALCWEIKNNIPETYEEAGIEYLVVHYEKLISTPRETIKAVLDFMGLDWHDDVLRHHRLHSGMSIGNTDNAAPINHSNMRKWEKGLSAAQISIISALCTETAKKFKYNIAEGADY